MFDMISLAMQKFSQHSAPFFDATAVINLEACGGGCELVVSCLWVTYKVIPAGKQLPTKGEGTILCSISSFIGISCHSRRRKAIKERKRLHIISKKSIFSEQNPIQSDTVNAADLVIRLTF